MTLPTDGDAQTHPDLPTTPAQPPVYGQPSYGQSPVYGQPPAFAQPAFAQTPTFAQRLRAFTWGSNGRRIASIVVGLVVIFSCCGVCASGANALAAIGATVTPDAQVTKAPKPTATPKATATPTATPLPTATLGPPTATVKPVATIVPEVARIQRILSGHIFTSHLDSVTWDAAHSSATINVSVSTQWDKSTAVFTCKQVAYDAYKALYTSGLHPTTTTIIMMGPTQDAYGNSKMSQYMRTDLTASNAAQFQWDNLLPDQTWNLYDNAVLALFLL